MLNYLWAGMIVIGVVYAVITGNMEAVTSGALEASKEAVTLCITMCGIMSLWTGLMEIASKSGLINKMTGLISPFVTYLFPNIPKQHKAREYISVNMVSNMLGLGWAATPAGLKAMEELARLEETRASIYSLSLQNHSNRTEKKKLHKQSAAGTASNEMCTFLIINISSLQLIPVNIIAFRSQYGSVNPTSIIGAGLIATFFSTIIAVIFCKWMQKRKTNKD